MKMIQNKNNRVEYAVPVNMIGLVIGKSGDTIKGVNARSGAFASLSREVEHQSLDKKILLVTGSPEAIELAKREIDCVIENGIRALQQKQNHIGDLTSFILENKMQYGQITNN